MNGFKLLAIRPLKGCNSELLKSLKGNTLYQFYQDYTFIFENNNSSKDVVSITYKQTVPDTLYNSKNLSINIAAILGKNGSGKSSLIELLFATIYNISVKIGILKDIEIIEGFVSELSPIEKLFIEIYYTIDENIYCLKIDENKDLKFKIIEFKNLKNKREFILSNLLENDQSHLRNFFFYTIAINYSLYGLNSEQMGIWIKSLFHKNDGYQTPVVINPYRDKGNININTELYLAKQRLLSNVLKPKSKKVGDSHLYLTDYQKVKSISFVFNDKKIEYAYRIGKKGVSFDELFKVDSRESLFNIIYDVFFDNIKPNSNIKFKDQVEKYIIKKIISIAQNYPEYSKYFRSELIEHIGEIGDTKNNTIKHNTHFIEYGSFLKELKKDKSHLTFKLNQAINYLKYDILKENLDEGFIWKNIEDEGIEQLNVIVDNLSKRIKLISNEREIIKLIPPSLFDIELHLISNEKSESLFSQLSSGEQQLIHSIQSIIYHAINLNSVFLGLKSNKNKLTFKCLNVILDEVELYFHPEYQKDYVKELIGALQRMNLHKIKHINILFSTHSPFILSDIPSQNILRIKRGEPQAYKENEQTFGANIYDLLEDSFFMESNFIGGYASMVINKIIQKLNLKDNLNNDKTLKDLIEIVGEPFLRDKLQLMYYEKYPLEYNKEKEIQILEKKLKMLIHG
jgi:predicted ATPase